MSRGGPKPPDDDDTQSAGRPLPRGEAVADSTSPEGTPIDADELIDDVPTKAVEFRPPGIPQKTQPGTEPTVNVSPDPALHNDPGRVLRAREELHRIPTVNVSPDPSLHNDPHRVMALPPLEEPQTMTGVITTTEPPAAITHAAALVPVAPVDPESTSPRGTPLPRPTGASAPTQGGSTQVPTANERVGVVGANERVGVVGAHESTVRTDPDATGAAVPWEEPPEDSTRKVDLPAEPKAIPAPRPSMRGAPPLGGPLGPPIPSAPRPVPSVPRPNVSAPRPRPSPKHDPAPPLDSGRVEPEPTQRGTALPDRGPVVPISILASSPAEPVPEETKRTGGPEGAWKQSPEVLGWLPEPPPEDRTVVFDRGTTGPGLRPPKLRDILVVAAGFILLVVGMGVLRKEPVDEGAGPKAPEKIRPPDGYEAPRLTKESDPYVPTPAKAPAAVAVQATPSSGGIGGIAAAAAAQEARNAVAPVAPTRLPTPRCAVNVPAMLETKVTWVTEAKRKLLRLRLTVRREAIQRVNLAIADAFDSEKAEVVRTEDAVVHFDVMLDPEPNANVVKVMLECECGLAQATVQATIDKQALKAELKYAKAGTPEVVAAKGPRRKR